MISVNSEVNGKAKHEPNLSRKERPQKRGGGGRYEPYGNVNKRFSVFVSNIPYDVKWQALKDLMKEKGRVTRGCELDLNDRSHFCHQLSLYRCSSECSLSLYRKPKLKNVVLRGCRSYLGTWLLI